MLMHVPFVSEKSKFGEHTTDIISRLLEDRIVMLHGEVCEETAQIVISQLLYLDAVSNEPITFYINSVGGVCTDGLAIIDVMHIIKSPVHTVSMGLSASMGAMILMNGDKRASLPNSEIMIHQPLGGAYGQCTDIQIQADNILKMKEKLIQMIADNSLLTYDEAWELCERDCFLTSEEAFEFGIIDSIVKYTDKG